MKLTNPKMSIAPWARTLLILPAFIVIVGLFEQISNLVLGIDSSNIHFQGSLFQETVGVLFTLIGTIVVVGIFRRFMDMESFRSMGFYPKGIGREFVFGLGLGAIIMATGFTTLVFIQEIEWTVTNFETVSILQSVSLFAMVSLSEELLLRGYVLNNLMKTMNRFRALILSSLMFTLLHVFNPNLSWIGFFNILLAGILLGLPYIYTQRLWLPLALHFSWNFFQGPIFGFHVSGHETYSLITQSRTTDNIWNGGTFGFEGSVLSLVYEAMAIFILWRYFNNKALTISDDIILPMNYEADVLVK